MSIDYKNTLNLPHTDFPMKADLVKREPEILARWEALDVYHELAKQRRHAAKFVLHDGPPYANGAIHIGHAVNKTLKDMVIKSQSLNGLDVPYIPGWDCHGLPIELNVEKKQGKPGEKISPREFRAACRDYAHSQIAIQKAAFIRLGVLGDWNNPYLTMAPSFEASIVRSLARIIEKAHLSRGYKPVHWCLDCQSSLAEAEVEYQDKTSASIYVCFEVVDQAAFIKAVGNNSEKITGKIAIPIWTTTPWTLPANQAVALNPNLNYSLIKTSEWILVIATDLIDRALHHCGIHDYSVIGHCSGADLAGLLLQHPFYARQVPVVLGEHVTTEAGTGAVHTAPAHGIDDYQMGVKYHLDAQSPVDARGCYIQDLPLLGGMHINKVLPVILDALREKNVLLHEDKITHSYPHCWRHKTPVIFRATPQWFVSMHKNNLLKTALHEIEKVQWIPTLGEKRISAMLNDRPDWCVSRQRVWGVPMCLILHKDTDELHPRQLELMEAVAKKIEINNIEAWYDLDLKELLGDEAQHYIKASDVLDVWFDSGVTHTGVLKARNLPFPANVYLEGSDQHRGWFQTSLLTSCAMYDEAPFKQVVTHGFTIDEHGRKMSKSLGNTIEPEQIFKTLGADILRLWIASTDYHGEMVVSDEIFKRTSELYRRLRNTARFLLSNLSGFDPAKDQVNVNELIALDAWAIQAAQQLQVELIEHYNAYEFLLVSQKIHHFCSLTMGSFYLDIIKDRQYTTQENSLARRSAQTAMFHIVKALTLWLAPICSFTADELWQYLPGEKTASVFLNTWHVFPKVKAPFDADYWQELMLVRDAVNKEIERLRNEKILGSNLEAEVVLFAEPELKAKLDKLGDELRFVLITSAAQVKALSVEPQGMETSVAGLRVFVGASSHQKCARCWHRREDVGTHADHPEICGRCVENVTGHGEVRQFA